MRLPPSTSMLRSGERPGRRVQLERLAGRIRGILSRGAPGEPGRSGVPTGWPAADALLTAGDAGERGGAALQGLAAGGVHEWIGVGARGAVRGRRHWSPPLALLAHLAWQALEAAESARADGPGRRSAGSSRVLWIGRAAWPYPRALVRDFRVEETARGRDGRVELALARIPRAERPAEPGRLLARSILVDAGSPALRLWAIDAALRCPSVAVVVADGSGLDMASSRRLQLAAEAGRGLALLARPPWEASALSAAATRWEVDRAAARVDRVNRANRADRVPCRRLVAPAAAGAPTPNPVSSDPRWTLALLRRKGVLGIGGSLDARCVGSSP